MKRKSKYSDKEIISFLQRKVNGERIPEDLITEKNLYGEEEPWFFFNNSEEKELFFFTNTSRKFRKGDRKSRTAGADGFWKGDTCGTYIEDDQGKIRGIRRTFTYLLKKGSALKTSSEFSLYRWTMHEYKLWIDEFTEGYFALCRVRRNLKSETSRKKSVKKEQIKIEEEENHQDGGGGGFVVQPKEKILKKKKKISKNNGIPELENGGVVGKNKSLKKKSGKKRKLEQEEDDGVMPQVPQPLMLKAKLELIPEVEHGMVMALPVPHKIVGAAAAAAADGTTRMAVVEEDMQDADWDTVVIQTKVAGLDTTIPQNVAITDDGEKTFDMLYFIEILNVVEKLYPCKEEESLVPSLLFTNLVDTYSNWMTGCELIPSKMET